MVIDLLQRIGFNKYEAEAYTALLQYGSLTGYELGKRSGVPLSRSYEILERLTAKGLALAQPGDPPRYAAEAPQQLLERTRIATSATLDALTRALAELGTSALPEGFWVIRGREHILAHANTCIAQAQITIGLSLATEHSAALADALEQARGRGCRIQHPAIDTRAAGVAAVLLVIDDRDAMVGTLTPADRAQAVVSANPGFVAVLGRCFVPQRAGPPPRTAESAMTIRETQPLAWLDWEERKQRRLLSVQRENRVA